MKSENGSGRATGPKTVFHPDADRLPRRAEAPKLFERIVARVELESLFSNLADLSDAQAAPSLALFRRQIQVLPACAEYFSLYCFPTSS